MSINAFMLFSSKSGLIPVIKVRGTRKSRPALQLSLMNELIYTAHVHTLIPALKLRICELFVSFLVSFRFYLPD